MSESQQTITIGSRGSALALWQANHVKALLEEAIPDLSCTIEIIHTKGDKIQDVALSKFGDKGLFTKELERALLDKRVDLCVHSMKDMPTELPEGLAILGVPQRASVNDALVYATKGSTIADLPQGARVATGSLRRVAQLKLLRPDFEVCEMRGNVDSRVKRVESGEFDAAILACAGLTRLGLESHMASVIPTTTMLPATGQGALAIEARTDDPLARKLCSVITDPAAMREVTAERIVLRELEGGCQVPMGIYAHEEAAGDAEPRFSLDAFVSSLDGSTYIHTYQEGEPEDFRAIGHAAAQDLIDQGARAILNQIREENGF